MVAHVSIRPAIADYDAGHPAWIDSVNGLFDDLRAARAELHRDSQDAIPLNTRGISDAVYIAVSLGALHEVSAVIKEWLRRQGRAVTLTVRDEHGERVITLDGSLPDEAIVEGLRPAIRPGPDKEA